MCNMTETDMVHSQNAISRNDIEITVAHPFIFNSLTKTIKQKAFLVNFIYSYIIFFIIV